MRGYPGSYVLFACKKERVLLIDKDYLKGGAGEILDADDSWTKIDVADNQWPDKLKSALIR